MKERKKKKVLFYHATCLKCSHLIVVEIFEDVIQMQLCILARLKQAPLISDTANLFHLKISCQHLILLIVMYAIWLSTVKLALLHPSGSPFWHSLCRKAWLWLRLSLDLRRFQKMQFRLSCGLNVLNHMAVTDFTTYICACMKAPKTPSMVWVCMFIGTFRSISIRGSTATLSTTTTTTTTA